MLNRDEVLAALNNVDGLPDAPSRRQRHSRKRTIYETGTSARLKPSGHLAIDYAAYPGGVHDEVPRTVIDELEREGIICRAFPDNPSINAWVLAEFGEVPNGRGADGI